MSIEKIYKLVTLLLVVITFAACNKPENTKEVIYRITLQSTWSPQTHAPEAYPSEAGFSPFVAFSHTNYVQFLDTQNIASPGVRAMAENGNISPLDQEIQDLIDTQSAFDLVTSTRIQAPGFANNQLSVNPTNGTVSIAAKIVPSPDWLVAATNVQLYENGEWIDRIVPLTMYDAGTMSGSGFYSLNTTPRANPKPIEQLTTGPLSTNNPNTTLGYVKFERLQ